MTCPASGSVRDGASLVEDRPGGTGVPGLLMGHRQVHQMPAVPVRAACVLTRPGDPGGQQPQGSIVGPVVPGAQVPSRKMRLIAENVHQSPS